MLLIIMRMRTANQDSSKYYLLSQRCDIKDRVYPYAAFGVMPPRNAAYLQSHPPFHQATCPWKMAPPEPQFGWEQLQDVASILRKRGNNP